MSSAATTATASQSFPPCSPRHQPQSARQTHVERGTYTHTHRPLAFPAPCDVTTRFPTHPNHLCPSLFYGWQVSRHRFHHPLGLSSIPSTCNPVHLDRPGTVIMTIIATPGLLTPRILTTHGSNSLSDDLQPPLTPSHQCPSSSTPAPSPERERVYVRSRKHQRTPPRTETSLVLPVSSPLHTWSRPTPTTHPSTNPPAGPIITSTSDLTRATHIITTNTNHIPF
ncbi:hypothetical protein O3P69_017103 [Scylla paramamosain]|uniref:Uncharacterized protein n=1 Tax=Scylla paramamosain TaxID=85552 RepID=A0AAW0TX14_SCYPA